ncbi:MAG: AAA family ATPase [Flavobacterium sp.]|nr:AAA family ATPase [Flavobacterium sp.]
MEKGENKDGGFRLIGITPLATCDNKFCKNLEIGKTYQFYNDFQIESEKDFSKIKSVTRITNNKINLYQLKNGINLSFSAVVGKNGTGKSTIFELLYYLIYAVSTDKSKGEGKILISEQNDLKIKQKEAQEDYSWFENCFQVNLKDKNKEELNDFDKEILLHDFKDPFLIALEMQKKYSIEIDLKKVTDQKSYIKAVKSNLHNKVLPNFYCDVQDEEKWCSFFRENFACSVLYESNSVIKEVSYQNSKFCYSEFDPNRIEKIVDVDNFDLSDFFYNISLNFSHHSLNSKTLGKWINRLFHKNDAYTTPVVINPMRENGNFNINHELKLSKERLMANILYDLVRNRKSYLLGKYKVSKFIFSPKVLSGLPPFDFTTEFPSGLKSSILLTDGLGIKKLDDYIDYWDYAIGYLEKKVHRIEENYGHLIHKDPDLFNEKEKFNKFLLEDKSHITKKSRQVVNFLKITYKRENRSFWKIPKDTVRIDFSEEKMLKWLSLFKLNLLKQSPSDLLEIGLPGFFTIDFLLEDKSGKKIEFSKLSSGEQQMIFNTNTILYHLFNLESIHSNNNKSKEKFIDRVEYRDINIILDEVELYYHPEMQRRLVADLIENFQRLKSKKLGGISAINVCILTHSPFVLSDIPSSNVLTLSDNNNVSTNQTLGSNIHEMLLGNFFMDSVTGEFVRLQIQDILNFYNKVRIETSQEGLNILKKKYDNLSERFKFLTKNIGEDIIREIISNHIDFIEEKLYEKD